MYIDIHQVLYVAGATGQGKAQMPKVYICFLNSLFHFIYRNNHFDNFPQNPEMNKMVEFYQNTPQKSNPYSKGMTFSKANDFRYPC